MSVGLTATTNKQSNKANLPQKLMTIYKGNQIVVITDNMVDEVLAKLAKAA